MNKAKNRRVLVITYHFPPNGGSGIFRALKFVKYLPKFGWEPVVLTAKHPFDFGSPKDPSLLKEIPKNITVHRTASFEPFNWYWNYRNRQRRTLSQKVTQQSQGKFHKDSLNQRIRQVFRLLLSFPDRHNGWLLWAVWRGWRIVRKEPIDALFVTSPPRTALMVGLTLKWLTGTPLVVDLRDLWTLSYSTQQLPKFVQRCHRLLEGFIFNKADRILTVSQIWRHQLQSAYPSIPEGCFATITNGFDPEDFQTTHRTTKVNDRFTITYTGALYGRQSAIPFFQALEGLVKEKPGLSQRLWVRFIGSLKSDDVHYLQMQPTLRSIVETQERVNHDRCLQLQEEADVLLLIVSRGQAAEGWYPSKVFEYLASNKPILTVAPNGAVKNLIKESGGGVVVDPDDISGIQQAILSLYNKYEKGQLTLRADPLNLKQFSRVELTCNLVRILNQLVGVTSSTTAPP